MERTLLNAQGKVGWHDITWTTATFDSFHPNSEEMEKRVTWVFKYIKHNPVLLRYRFENSDISHLEI